MKQLNVYCDGGARGNPGPAASAFLAFAGTEKVFEGSQYIGVTTNNVAEYRAVILAMTMLSKKLRDTKQYALSFFLDSELVVKQLTGRYRIKSSHLQPLSLLAKKLELSFGKVVYSNISRDKNASADALVNQCLDATT